MGDTRDWWGKMLSFVSNMLRLVIYERCREVSCATDATVAIVFCLEWFYYLEMLIGITIIITAQEHGRRRYCVRHCVEKL